MHRYAMRLLQRSGKFLQRKVGLGADDLDRKRNVRLEFARRPGRTALRLA